MEYKWNSSNNRIGHRPGKAFKIQDLERDKIGDKLAVQEEGSISNNYTGDLDSRPRKFSEWGQIQLIVEQH